MAAFDRPAQFSSLSALSPTASCAGLLAVLGGVIQHVVCALSRIDEKSNLHLT